MQTGITYTHKGVDSSGLGTTGQVNGWIDSLTPVAIGGWAADFSNPTVPVTVALFMDGGLIGTAMANQSRPDLVTNAGIDANHGWSFAIPTVYQDGQSHTFNVKVNNTDISGSPSSIVTSNAGLAPAPVLLPGTMNQVPAGSPGTPTILGMDPTTALLIGGGLLLVMFMMKGK